LTVIAEEPTICKYIDMPLQHVSDRILASMHRRSTEQTVREVLKRIKQIPEMAIRTNFIVGYPGETEQDFEKLKELVKEEAFHKVGVFTYSREAGTTAAKLKQQIPPKVALRRYEELVEIQSRVLDKMNKQRLHSECTVLLDTPTRGRTQHEAPDIDGGIIISSSTPLQPGRFARVRITGADGYLLRGDSLTP
jgi:ribosomal protein S12 methylthiotransferase